MTFDFIALTDRLERVYSERLALRPVSLSDGWPLYCATQNPLFNRHLLWDRPADENVIFRRMDKIMDDAQKGRLTALSAVTRKTGEWVSLFRFLPYGNELHTLEMGIWTHDRFWHGEYSLELGRMCVDACFENSSVLRLIGAAAPENRSSCHLMRRVGMSVAQLVVRPTENGGRLPLQEFDLTRDRWTERQRRGTPVSAVPNAADVDWVRGKA